jgi:DNA-binding beta-propeller fold protein YncE
MMTSRNRRYRRRAGIGAILFLLAPLAAQATSAEAPLASGALTDVVLVGNSASGTVTVLDGHTFADLGSINVIPDLQQRLDEMNPIEAIAYAEVRRQEGGDRFVDDVYVSPDGRTLYVSRGNLNDVVAVDIASRSQQWRFKTAGFKADHAALSPDGTRFIVSATTAEKAQVLDTASGSLVAEVRTGTYPHGIDYSADGTRIYNASIGIVSLPKLLNVLKGRKQLTVIDAQTFRVLKTYQLPYGIRPAVITPDDRTMYAQLSYLNGFIEYDLTRGRIARTIQMPFSAAGQALSPDDYPRNSAHHGMAMSGDGSRLCDVGTIDDYAAIIARPALTADGFVHYPTGALPYWATTSVDGGHCLVSLSNADAVSVVDYASATEVARVPVGDFPQRLRLGRVDSALLGALD